MSDDRNNNNAFGPRTALLFVTGLIVIAITYGVFVAIAWQQSRDISRLASAYAPPGYQITNILATVDKLERCPDHDALDYAALFKVSNTIGESADPEKADDMTRELVLRKMGQVTCMRDWVRANVHDDCMKLAYTHWLNHYWRRGTDTLEEMQTHALRNKAERERRTTTGMSDLDRGRLIANKLPSPEPCPLPITKRSK